MTDSKKGRPSFPRFAEGEQDSLYEVLGGTLQGVLTRIFAIPKADAQWLVREVFIVYRGLNPAPPDARSWLIGGACRSATRYRERRGLTTGDEAEQTRAVEQLLRREEALALLPDRARAVLRLRFEEGKSYSEIAEKLGVTLQSAKRIVSSAAAMLRKLNRAG
jgi:RNA polymerase sigma factor (sigma-70 family)